MNNDTPKSTTPTPQDIKDRFIDLACELSPENLSCDGELPQAEVERKLRRIRAEWAELEGKLGRKVSESEVWDWTLAQA